jgi:hypothetical protein
MVLITWILRFLVALILLRLILRAIFGKSLATRRKNGPAGRRAPERIGGTLVRCDHCRTARPQGNMITVGARSFCSADCRAAYEADQRRAG